MRLRFLKRDSTKPAGILEAMPSSRHEPATASNRQLPASVATWPNALLLCWTRLAMTGQSRFESRSGVLMPMLGQLRRTDDVGEDVEYYRVRSFSITPNGIFNLGDSFRSRRSRSINSASSSGSSQSINSTPSHRERVPRTGREYLGELSGEQGESTQVSCLENKERLPRQLGTAIWVPRQLGLTLAPSCLGTQYSQCPVGRAHLPGSGSGCQR
uniref:Uncharacterized protein n=1 Tax=Timema bartmani TaxID=61472 RepID=A0A7R9F7R5_9NEOP|nr:unnamed protein product [Timema bartmani]